MHESCPKFKNTRISQIFLTLGAGNFSKQFIFWKVHVIFAAITEKIMPKKIKPTGKQISTLVMHMVIFAIGSAAMLLLYDKGATKWVYPWPAWTVAAWGLCLVGHICLVFTSTEDTGYDVYRKQQGHDK